MVSKKQSAGPKSWDVKRQKLNPKDYQFMNKTDETLVKPPGYIFLFWTWKLNREYFSSINGEQFVIDTCKVFDDYEIRE